MPFFTTLTQQRMCEEIAAARQGVVLAAPGVGQSLADALIAAHSRLGEQAVQVVLDVSATVCRLGYGDHDAVERLAAAGVALHHQPGLRLGVLICDRHGWSFAGAARLVEADPRDQDDACNAIALTEAQILALRAELPASPAAPAIAPIIGKKRVAANVVEHVRHALDIAPPQPFDLARQTRVYNALLQFVELEIEGFNLQNRRVQLPGTLPVIASKDRAVKERISASLKVLEKIEKPKSLLDIGTRFEDLRKAYLLPVGRAGRIVLKNKRAEFEKELAEIEKDLERCKKDLQNELTTALTNTVKALVPDLARAVLADPPLPFRGKYPLNENGAQEYVRRELDKTFPKAQALVHGMRVHKFFKDVTYETLKDEEFAKKVHELIPPSTLAGALLEEHDVVTARDDAP